MELKKSKLVWGAINIGKVINRSPRQTFALLESGQLPAKKVGGRWVGDEDRLIGACLPDTEEVEAA